MKPFRSWLDLNGWLMTTTDEKLLNAMLRVEIARNPVRKMFVKRIAHRLSRVRHVREKEELSRKGGWND